MGEELQCRGTEFYDLGKELVESGLSLRFAVHGRSMFPFLRDGDVIQVTPTSLEELRKGDIIFYRSGDRLLAHRVVGFVTTVGGRCARARGDAFLQEDPPIAGVDLIGSVETVSRLHRGKWRQMSLSRGWTRFTGVLVARSRVVHRCVRWTSRTWLRLAGVRRRWQRPNEDHQESEEAVVEEQGL